MDESFALLVDALDGESSPMARDTGKGGCAHAARRVVVDAVVEC